MEQWQKTIEEYFQNKNLLGCYINKRSNYPKRLIVTWNIGTEICPSKRSVEIIIDIDDELNYVWDQVQIDKVNRYLEQKFNDFEPQHDTAYGEQQPQVKWVLNLDLLN